MLGTLLKAFFKLLPNGIFPSIASFVNNKHKLDSLNVAIIKPN